MRLDKSTQDSQSEAQSGQSAANAVRAVWGEAVLAESASTIMIEGNHYFPPQDVNFEYLSASSRQSTCPWKGVASYYDVVVGGHRNQAAAWQYPEPKPKAVEIKDYVAFWNGVDVKSS
jgi:uncharacterized protein (DUF427 family)